MNRPSMRVVLGLFSLWMTAEALRAADSQEPETPPPAGVVVERLGSGFAADRAGLMAGDVLLEWHRAGAPPANPRPAAGSIDSPFTLIQVEIEEAPRGELTLIGRRGDQPLIVRVPPGPWWLATRPGFTDNELDSYHRGHRLLDAGSLREGAEIWRQLANNLADADRTVAISWLHLRIARTAVESQEWAVAEQAFEQARRAAQEAPNPELQILIVEARAHALEKARQVDKADRAFRSALELRSSLPESLALARILDALGNRARARGDVTLAESLLKRALDLQQRLAPQSLEVARSLTLLGVVQRTRGNEQEALRFYRRAMILQEHLAPQSLDLATTLRPLAIVAINRGEMSIAASHLERALAIRLELEPESLMVADLLLDLGTVALNRGELRAAGDFFQRALILHEKLAPLGLDHADSLNNLGIVAINRGDLAAAESYYRRSLTLVEKLAPQSHDAARSLNNLGVVAIERGDLLAARNFHRRSLAIVEHLANQTQRALQKLERREAEARARQNEASAEDFAKQLQAVRLQHQQQRLSVASSLNNLGNVARDLGYESKANDFHRRALGIQEELAPDSINAAKSLTNLGGAALERGDLESAERDLNRAYAIYQTFADSHVEAAEILCFLGDIAVARGDLRSAEEKYQRSLAIRRQRAPGSTDVAESCQRLARLRRRQGQMQQAQDLYRCAVKALETQKGKLGGSEEVRSGFAAKYASIYHEAIDLLVELDEKEAAFNLLERYRARELLALLAERDLILTRELSSELLARRRAANRGYDRALKEWMALTDEVSEEQHRAALRTLEEARRRQDQIRADVRTESPRLADLEDPRPLQLDSTRTSLDPGTLLLSFMVGEKRSLLFTLGSSTGELGVFKLDIGRQELEHQIKRFREAIGRGRIDPRPGKVLVQSVKLTTELLAPATKQIRAAERLLVLADGPLHSLPFAALIAPGEIKSAGYLVERVAIHRAVSATVFALLRHQRRHRQPVSLTAFGDAKYLASTDQPPPTPRRPALRSGFDLRPLPATRREVEALRELFPRSSLLFLGDQAAEKHAKRVGVETTHLHIATHGLLNDRFPLDSALAFSTPLEPEGQENGLLQAWEVFEQVQLDADLVTLSACDTGLGKEMGGEGLLGLTRAFQFAGARSVLASLWGVSDGSTGELMTRFYTYLKAGESKAEALRHAQIDLLRTSEFTHPFHWAGFELVGDWR